MKLTKATIFKYKGVENEQAFSIEPDITVLVGMNESGKTSLLEALAKVNYFEDDNDFIFNKTHDYPRKQKKMADKSPTPIDAVTLEYSVDKALIDEIEADILIPFKMKAVTYTKKYDNQGSFSTLHVSLKTFLKRSCLRQV